MTTRSIHWQNPTRDYVLFCADGTEQSVSTVEQEVVDVQGDGKVGLYKVRVLHIMEVAIDGSRSEVAELPDSYAERLADFIAALLLDHAPARHSAEITFDLGGEVRSW
ncbi:hypothetical protein [Sphingomonas hankyongi]|uniref:Uncharacterized protein n=1 Tax=Sphingomonas hankyongi TaxID=2908209 RepID=A0ABT0RY49_9SPHN|nr:hypothetical protein [Sphingomonas hankyongi]MCL6728530.1 hypothetical protein [Sphingomonas hankyongi]